MKKLILLLILLPCLGECQILETLAKLRNNAQQQIDFDSTTTDLNLIGTTDWNNMINRACFKVAYDANVLFQHTKLNISSGTFAYEIDTAMLDINYIIHWRDSAFQSVKRWQVPFMTDKYDVASGKVEGTLFSKLYWVQGDSIYFWPTPIQTDSVLVGYTIYPILLSADATATNISVEHREAIIWYTCYLALLRLSRPESAVYLAKYNDEIKVYVARESERFDILR